MRKTKNDVKSVGRQASMYYAEDEEKESCMLSYVEDYVTMMHGSRDRKKGCTREEALAESCMV